MMNTLYISDLDGTLLQPDATLSTYSRDTLNQLIEDGLQFTAATARSIASVTEVLAGLRLNLPIIEFNGAFITDFYTGHHLLINEMDSAIVQEIFELAVRTQITPFVSTFNGKQDRLYYSEPDNEGMAWFLQNRQRAKDPRLCVIDDPTAMLKEQVVSFTIIGRKRPLTDLEQQCKSTFNGKVETQLFENQYSPDWHWLTFHDSRASKEIAIQSLIELTSLQPQEVVAFGDQINDIRMLKTAHRGIAVDNAIPALKAVANQTIEANSEDSVVRFIENDWK